MKGILETSGLVVKNKKEAIKEAKELLDRWLETDPDCKEPWVYVMRHDNPQSIWFSVGYVERKNIANYVRLA